jgi:hypothetical protein
MRVEVTYPLFASLPSVASIMASVPAWGAASLSVQTSAWGVGLGVELAVAASLCRGVNPVAQHGDRAPWLQLFTSHSITGEGAGARAL